MIKRKAQTEKIAMLDKLCPKRPCFRVGEDKGTFVQGRGYTHYHDKPRLVCFTRHLHGCPVAGVCPKCNTVYVPMQTKCMCGEPLP